MPKAEWGAKHLCSCGAKFYDMGNPAVVCPKCGTVPDDGRRGARHATEATEAAEAEKSHPVADNEADDGVEDGFTDDDGDDVDDSAHAVASG